MSKMRVFGVVCCNCPRHFTSGSLYTSISPNLSLRSYLNCQLLITISTAMVSFMSKLMAWPWAVLQDQHWPSFLCHTWRGNGLKIAHWSSSQYCIADRLMTLFLIFNSDQHIQLFLDHLNNNKITKFTVELSKNNITLFGY